MEAVIMLALPIVVSILTQAIKSLETIRFSDNKNAILRFFAVTVSFVGVVLTAVSTGHGVGADQISTYAEALLVFLSTQVPYIYGKLKRNGA